MAAFTSLQTLPWVRWPLLLLAMLLLLVLGVWGGMALWYQMASPVWLRATVIAAWSALGVTALGALCGWLPSGTGEWTPAAFVLCLVALLAWWTSVLPSHQRVWADDVSRMLESQLDGHQVTLSNVRNFTWRGEQDYDVNWETRRYDLDQLRSADLVLSYWMGPAIAHTLVSFGFADGRRLVFSLEIRREKGEAFSALGGFFRQFETVIVAADESDIIRTRTNARGEDVYLYRLNLTPQQLRSVFLGYLERAAALHRQPTFYNTLTSNCTTIVFELARRLSPSLPLDYRLLASGYFAEYVFDQGGLVSGHGFAELKQAGHITARARATTPADDFGRAIRIGVPGVTSAELQ